MSLLIVAARALADFANTRAVHGVRCCRHSVRTLLYLGAPSQHLSRPSTSKEQRWPFCSMHVGIKYNTFP